MLCYKHGCSEYILFQKGVRVFSGNTVHMTAQLTRTVNGGFIYSTLETNFIF